MGGLVTALLDSLIGDGCAACAMPGPPLCAACAQAVPPVGPCRCARCGHPWATPRDACPQCIEGVAWARQATVYSPPVPAVVSALKDQHRRALAPPLAGLLVQRVEAPPPGAVLVPVPLSPRRLADRGFNQAELIATHLARAWHLPVRGALARHDAAAPQRGSGARQRRHQVAGAFRARTVVPLHAVLVDDVVTTGATLAAAARALRAAGCARVGAVALARVATGREGTRVG